MFNIAICDDDTFFIDYIEKVIVEVNGSDKDINFYEYTKGKSFLWDVEDGMDIDLLILDIKLDDANSKSANVANSKEVVKICTQYAQKGMINIFIALFAFALAFACLSAPSSNTSAPVAFFVSYLIAIAVFGLFQAVFMANAGGCWDNAKKIVEVDLQEKGTPLHEATVVGDTVGDPFKDTSSVAMNPIIKFTTLFGLLAMEIAISESFRNLAPIAGWVFLIIALIFVIRSFYAMRIPSNK